MSKTTPLSGNASNTGSSYYATVWQCGCQANTTTQPMERRANPSGLPSGKITMAATNESRRNACICHGYASASRQGNTLPNCGRRRAGVHPGQSHFAGSIALWSWAPKPSRHIINMQQGAHHKSQFFFHTQDRGTFPVLY